MAKQAPTHVLYLLPDNLDDKWEPVGPGWVNRDGSINLVVKSPLPEGARVQLRRRKPKATSATATPAASTTTAPVAPASDA